jgi:hypothetical protein
MNYSNEIYNRNANVFLKWIDIQIQDDKLSLY